MGCDKFRWQATDAKECKVKHGGTYLPADVALDILMNILILDGADNVDCIHQHGWHLDLGDFHDGDQAK
jgi:hypothetical protein